MSGIPDDDYHQLLVHQNRERIELAAIQAIEQQLEIPVVLLLDLADRVATAILDTAGMRSRVQPTIAEYQRRGLLPVLLWHLPGSYARDLLQNYYPNLNPFLPLADPNAFYTVVLSRDGISMGVLQLP